MRRTLTRILRRFLVALVSVAFVLLTFVASLDTVIHSEWAGQRVRAYAICGYCDDDSGCYNSCAEAYAQQQLAAAMAGASGPAGVSSSSAGGAVEWNIVSTTIAVGFVVSVTSGLSTVFDALMGAIGAVLCFVFNLINGIVDLINAIPFVDIPNLQDVLNVFWGLGDIVDEACNGSGPGTVDGGPPPITTYCADQYGSQITDSGVAAQCCSGASLTETTSPPPTGCDLGSPGEVDIPELAAVILVNTMEIAALTADAKALEGAEDAEVAAGEGVPDALPIGSEAKDAGFASSKKKPGAATDGDDAGALDPKTGKRKPPGPGSGFGDLLGSLFGSDGPGSGAPTGAGAGTGGKKGSADDSTYQTSGAAGLRDRGGRRDDAAVAGGGSTVETWGPSGTGELAGEVNPMGSEEPDDYFGLAGDEGLFKRVERRYKKRSGDWHQEDLDALRDRAREKAERKLK